MQFEIHNLEFWSNPYYSFITKQIYPPYMEVLLLSFYAKIFGWFYRILRREMLSQLNSVLESLEWVRIQKSVNPRNYKWNC